MTYRSSPLTDPKFYPQFRFKNNRFILPLSTILIIGATSASMAVSDLFNFLQSALLGSTATASTDSYWLLLSWLIGTVATAVVLIYRDSSLLRFLCCGHTPINNKNNNDYTDDKTLKPDTDTTPHSVYDQAAYSLNTEQPKAFDIFDPADLPPRLSEYASVVYRACDNLGNFFGFQDSSVRNQAEHILILLSNNRRYMNNHISHQPPSPNHALHSKVFSNYIKWCTSLGTAPHFSHTVSTSVVDMAAPPSVASHVVDLVLFFCVWGEACNIRHMPECLWFLYHKMMEEYIMSVANSAPGVGGRSLYAGHYLDYVVTPIYKIVSDVSCRGCCSSVCIFIWFV